jgi:hypothetical protein
MLGEMGRIWNFFNQDADKAIDRLVQPYVRWALGHGVILGLGNVALVALVWILVSRTLALLIIAFDIGLVLYGIATLIRRDHAAR